MKERRILGPASRLAKLRAMSAGEIAERVRYSVLLEVERQQHRTGRLVGNGDSLAGRLTSTLRGHDWRRRLLDSRATRRGFLPGLADRDGTRALLTTEYRRELDDTRSRAESARAHRFEFFGRTFAYGQDIDWQADPVTGQRWPARFHADMPIHGGDVGYGDVKHVWELNRQQYVVDLGKAYFLTGDTASLAALQHLVQSWIGGNPYATGVNWSCALEPAFRAISWLWAYHLTHDALDEGVHVAWLASFHDHAWFIGRHLELYSSPYNHLAGEAAALYMLASSFPEFESSHRWRVRARQVLEQRLSQQFYSDGGSVEQSTFYHHATLGFYLLALLTARTVDEDFSPAVWQAVERAIDFSAALIQPDGRTPEIGGADDGKAIRMEHLPLWDFRPFQAMGAVLFDRPDLKTLAGRFHEDAVWMLGPEGHRRFAMLPNAPPPPTTAVFHSSGYVVGRSDWSPHADYLCFDAGEQAAGMRTDGVPNSMHGHADCLSVVLWLGGRRVLVDSGLFAYNCGGEWEAHFRETAAHNTARIDGHDQARHIRKMAWSHSYRAALEDVGQDDHQMWAIASHDGYARGPNGVVHRRVAWLRPGGYLLVHDEFSGHGDHEIEVNWQFAPGSLDLADAARACFGGDVDIAWVGSDSWRVDLRHGGERPSDGWICRSLGVREPAPRLTLTATLTTGVTGLLTVFAHRGAGTTSTVVVPGPSASTLVRVVRHSRVDWVAAAHVSDGGPLTTDAKIAVCGMTSGTVVDKAQAGGTYMRLDHDRLAQLDSEVSL